MRRTRPAPATVAAAARPLDMGSSRGLADGPRRLVAAALDLLPIGLLVLAAVVRPARLPVLVLLTLGTVAAWRVDRRRTAGWAAAVPVAISFAWGLVPAPEAARDGSTCASPAAPFATYRVAEAVLALGAVAVLARWLGGGGEELGLRRPAPSSVAVGLGAFAICGPLGLLAGPTLAAPFFGRVEIAIGDPLAIVPALLFALSNSVMEEVVYRGSLRAWTSRITGPSVALVGQAIVFGVAHSGPDFAGSALPVAAAMFAGGLIAGLIVQRTGSLFVPIMVHLGLDIPLYYGNACRLP